MHDVIRQRFKALNPQAPFCSLRFVETQSEALSVRKNVQQPLLRQLDRGVMISVVKDGGFGYAATSDLSVEGLQQALRQAEHWAQASGACSVLNYSQVSFPVATGRHVGPAAGQPLQWDRRGLLDVLMQESSACQQDARIVDWSVHVRRLDSSQLYLTSDGSDLEQHFRYLIPSLTVTAFANGEAQTRSLGGQYNGFCQQGGSEILAVAGLEGAGVRVADEALQLLAAPNCPSGIRDLLLMPEQMMLQIHESIGHPLELDRILGDERNYAGTSFVTPDMFGHYQYGSPLLNVSYDPSRQHEFASFGWDDDGSTAEKTLLIKDGILLRPLGGHISQTRAALPGVANSRACNWNRAPIDRMANLNIEPGTSSLEDMIANVESGVLMDTNSSWSIDDSRNKFQFGCEWGRLIENGKLTHVVKNPGYRGISATFWRSLKAVGNEASLKVMGTPFCGKGEPNQVIRVGHAAPACLFASIDVFGGEN
ncbi:MAG TPA: TldD/PmbA family protein [Dongiaceae bacterium]|nr:TldD/PmbA family protein [Dongiaceae bacterium]